MMSVERKHDGVAEYKGIPKQLSFNPYSENGGSIVAVAGDNFAIIASDTRLSAGYQIYTREQSKLFRLSKNSVLGCAGCWCDVLALTRLVQVRMQMYLHEHTKIMPTPAIAQMLSTLLYYKRFFPYYVVNILAGLDSNGKGVVYSYDPIGHHELSKFRAIGSAGPLLQPLLDNQLGMLNQENVKDYSYSLEKALAVVKDVFISAAERDIFTGDSIAFLIIKEGGEEEFTFKLRRD